ncbi:response regulator receiver domain-containing [Trichoderma arundinaceum]|uniref:Response regulator receiver domain-containing n=1 Tax=Trichoderma arundinaceum TaxID=490622 RepID=A0A395NHM1_TRIAR|nr:response regulator receiver domain-containing [Trichoderma arundinaceum]
MAPDIANKLKATLFRRRRRESSASTTDGLEPSPPTTPGISTTLRRPSFPFPREPSSQTLTLSLELMTEDGGAGIGGCGGGDDHSDAGESAQTSNDADQQRPKQHWRRRRSRVKQDADAENPHSAPEGVAHEDGYKPAPLWSPVSPVSPASPGSPVSPTSQAAPTIAAATTLPKHARGVVVSSTEKEKGADDIDDEQQQQQQQREADNSPATDTDAAVGGAVAASPIAAPQRQALTGELQVLPALDQRQPQRPHELPASAGSRVQGQSPRRSLKSEEASGHQHQSQLDGQGLPVINSDQGTIAGTATSASARIITATTATANTSTGTGTGTGGGIDGGKGSSTSTSTSASSGAVVAVSAGSIPGTGGDLQQKQQQRQAQKRPRQPAPPFPPSSLPSTSPPHSQAPSALLAFPPLPPPTPGPGNVPSLPSLDSIDEDESQSPSPLQTQAQSPFFQQQQASAFPAAEQFAATGRGLDAPSSPGAGHGPLNLNPASPPLPSKPPPAEVEPLPVKPSPALAPPSAASVSAEKSSIVANAPARPSAPPRRASRDPNQTVTFDDSPQRSSSTKKNNSGIEIATARSDAIVSRGTETLVAVASSTLLAPPSSIPAAPSIPAQHVEFEYYQSSIADPADFDASSMAETTRKIWVMRPKASATLITINQNDLVDDVRDMILRKYANSLGKTFDSPDLTLRIHPRDSQHSRVLGPEEPMGSTIDQYYPGGQTVKEALIIDIPRNTTTPRPSPRAPVYYADDVRPSETGEGYFPLVPGNAASPRLPAGVPMQQPNGSMPHSMAVINNGHLPAIPSPGGTRPRSHRDREQRHDRQERSDRQDYPRTGRNHTPSPNLHNGGGGISNSVSSTAVNVHGVSHYHPRHGHSRTHSSSSEQLVPHSSSMPKSPGHEMTSARMNTPPPQRLSSPRLSSSRPKKNKKSQQQQQEYHHSPSPSVLNATVPSISVLIVEDNPINLKLLEAFVKRLKVRWQTAMNGRDAVKKWRGGGFHLVLMDIQLPGMNGLEATREIRRLERVNNIGVFSSAPGTIPETTPTEELTEQDRLESLAKFKSPVIIVALTASSLQSDRHEALAAGCNDFLTKPVNFVWLERKVMEWGCMQALIDFDGWRKWKDYSAKAEAIEAANKRAQQAYKNKAKKNRTPLSAS